MPDTDSDDVELVTERAQEIYEHSVYTKRQSEVLALDEAGYSSTETARELGISLSMVGTHHRNAQERLEQAAWTLMDSDVLVHTLQTGQGPKMFMNLDSVLELRG